MSAQARFERVLADHGGMLWRIVCVYEADAELQRDLHQEVLLAVWKALPRFAGRASERTYLARIANNRCISHVSREVARPVSTELPEDLPAPAAGPEESATAQAALQRLRSAVRCLTLDQRQVITLALEGLPPREIAAVLGVSANVVSIRLTRAKSALRAQMSVIES